VRDTDDVVQESFLRLWKARAAHPIQCAKAFLFRVARHVALDSVVAQKRSPIEAIGNLAELPVVEEKADVIEAISANEKVRMVAAALVALPPRCREVVMLRKLRGLSRAEVATRLGISEKTVDEQLARGIGKLEAILHAQGADRHFQP
jgi:RNA polymerase sigma-70 factor (ECF subfamily)